MGITIQERIRWRPWAHRQFDFLVYGAKMVGSEEKAVSRPEGPVESGCVFLQGAILHGPHPTS